ncbi:hypothetical protein M8J77_025466 [Diaphorina citri]|nr:hypothetical protein M8J77_025466 [Diaphorina citri]
MLEELKTQRHNTSSKLKDTTRAQNSRTQHKLKNTRREELSTYKLKPLSHWLHWLSSNRQLAQLCVTPCICIIVSIRQVAWNTRPVVSRQSPPL